jgi:hypothetical protein
MPFLLFHARMFFLILIGRMPAFQGILSGEKGSQREP